MVVTIAATYDLLPLLLIGLLLVVVTSLTIRATRGVRAKARRVLILGSGPMASKLVEEIESPAVPRYVVAGIVDDGCADPEASPAARWLGPFSRLTEIVTEVRPACIVVAAADRRDRLPMAPLLESRVRGVAVEDAVAFYERLTGKMAIEALRPSALILSKGFRNHGAAETVARVVSFVAAAIGLVLLAPVLVALAVAIKLDSRGSVFFVQERAGRDGRPFGLVKFRTMHPCAKARSEWVMDNIDRITRLGGWLRRFRLDELPQLVNVLRGEMNLIGPRPHPTSNHAIFMEQIAYYGLRSTVRPGVTGWAQVRYGYANNLDEETEKMRYDLYYIKNRSLWLDARIAIETVGIVLFAKGASEVRRPSPSRDEMPAARHRPETVTGFVPWIGGPTVRQPAGRQ